MPTRVAFLSLVLLSCTAVASAQFAKTMHSNFPTDGVEVIDIRLVDSVTVDYWAGNTILVQTDIRLYNASKGLFDFLTGEDGRYQVDASTEGTTLNLVNVKPSRAPLQTKQGTCREEINVKVLLPVHFAGEGMGPFRVQAPEPPILPPADTLPVRDSLRVFPD